MSGSICSTWCYVYVRRYDANKICCNAHPDAPLIEDYRAGDQICSECGLVVGDRFVTLMSYETVSLWESRTVCLMWCNCFQSN